MKNGEENTRKDAELQVNVKHKYIIKSQLGVVASPLTQSITTYPLTQRVLSVPCGQIQIQEYYTQAVA